MIGSLMNMSLLIKNLTNYVQTKTDKEDAKLLRKLLTDDLSEQEQIKIIRHVFSDLIKWSYDDLVIHLTQVFNFTDDAIEKIENVVLNNDFLGMVRQWQQLFFDKRYASTEMVNPDFVAIAKGYYLDSERVKDRKDLKPAVERMIKSKKPYVLEICVEKENNVFPMIPSGASVSDVRLS